MRCLLLLAFGACASAPSAPVDPGPATSSYWPLEVGAKMRFKSRFKGKKSSELIRIVREIDGWFYDNHGGKMRHDLDGLFDGQRYLMRRPLRAGASWMAVPRPGVIERFRVVGVGRPCKKPHQKVSDCLIVEARQAIGQGGDTMLTRWWYGRGLGPLRIEHFVQRRSGLLKPRGSTLRRLASPQ